MSSVTWVESSSRASLRSNQKRNREAPRTRANVSRSNPDAPAKACTTSLRIVADDESARAFARGAALRTFHQDFQGPDAIPVGPRECRAARPRATFEQRGTLARARQRAPLLRALGVERPQLDLGLARALRAAVFAENTDDQRHYARSNVEARNVHFDLLTKTRIAARTGASSS